MTLPLLTNDGGFLNQSDCNMLHLNFITRCFFSVFDFELRNNSKYSILRIFIRQINLYVLVRTFVYLGVTGRKFENLANRDLVQKRTQLFLLLSEEVLLVCIRLLEVGFSHSRSATEN